MKLNLLYTPSNSQIFNNYIGKLEKFYDCNSDVLREAKITITIDDSDSGSVKIPDPRPNINISNPRPNISIPNSESISISNITPNLRPNITPDPRPNITPDPKSQVVSVDPSIKATLNIARKARELFVEKAKKLGNFDDLVWVNQLIRGMKQAGVQGFNEINENERPVTSGEVIELINLLIDLISDSDGT